MTKIRAIGALTRVYMSLLAGLTAAVSTLISGNELPKGSAILVAIVMFCLAAAGFVINDYLDTARDRINQPSRPLVSGTLSNQFALILATLLLIGGSVVAIRFNSYAKLCFLVEATLVNDLF